MSPKDRTAAVRHDHPDWTYASSPYPDADLWTCGGKVYGVLYLTDGTYKASPAPYDTAAEAIAWIDANR